MGGLFAGECCVCAEGDEGDGEEEFHSGGGKVVGRERRKKGKEIGKERTGKGFVAVLLYFWT